MRHYQLNPEYPKDAMSVNGVNFDRDTVVSGDQWEQFTKTQFPGIPPLLVQTQDAATITTAPPYTPAARQAKRKEPKPVQRGPSGALSTTAMAIDGEREKAAKLEEAAKAEEAAKLKAKVAVSRAIPEPPVKVLRPEHEKREEAGAHEEEVEELELVDIRGVGAKIAELLEEAGYEDVTDVAEADSAEMLKAVKKAGGKMNLATARSIVKSAKELLEE